MPKESRSSKPAKNISERKRRTVRNRSIRKKEEENEEEKENAYLEIISMAALGSIAARHSSKIKTGDLEVYIIHEKRDQIFTFYKLPGVGIPDLVSKQRQRTDYLPSRRKNIGNSELFAYVKLMRSDTEEHIKTLQNHRPPILEVINVQSNGELRYGIADAMLKSFIIDGILTLFEVYAMMEKIWIYKRWIRSEEKEWYNRLFGRQGRGTRVTSGYLWLRNNREGLRIMDEKRHMANINHANKMIAHHNRFIKEYYHNLIMTENYEDVRRTFQIITTPLIEIIFPKFVRILLKIGEKE
jgi:hypothetical protein